MQRSIFHAQSMTAGRLPKSAGAGALTCIATLAVQMGGEEAWLGLARIVTLYHRSYEEAGGVLTQDDCVDKPEDVAAGGQGPPLPRRTRAGQGRHHAQGLPRLRHIVALDYYSSTLYHIQLWSSR
jgi:hypothetical protein